MISALQYSIPCVTSCGACSSDRLYYSPQHFTTEFCVAANNIHPKCWAESQGGKYMHVQLLMFQLCIHVHVEDLCSA